MATVQRNIEERRILRLSFTKLVKNIRLSMEGEGDVNGLNVMWHQLQLKYNKMQELDKDIKLNFDISDGVENFEKEIVKAETYMDEFAAISALFSTASKT